MCRLSEKDTPAAAWLAQAGEPAQTTRVTASSAPRRAKSVKMPGSAAGSIARIASTTIAVRQPRPSSPSTALLHAIVGGDSVDDEERIVLVVARDELVRVAAAEHVELAFLQGEVRRQLAAQRVPTGRTTESGRAVAGNPPLALGAGHAVGRELPKLGIVSCDASRLSPGSGCRGGSRIVSAARGSERSRSLSARRAHRRAP